MMPNTDSAGRSICPLPYLLDQLQTLNPGPHEFHHWALTAPPKPSSDCSQRSTHTPGRPITCALFSIQHHSHLQTFIKCPLQIPATCRLSGDPENHECCLLRVQLSQRSPSPTDQPGGSLLPLIGHKIGHVLGVARPWQPCQVHAEVPGE